MDLLYKMVKISSFLILIMFFLSGFSKIKNFNDVSSGLVKSFSKMMFFNLPLWFAKLSIVLVILLEIFAPSLIFYSNFNQKYKKYAKYSIYLLIVFIIFATYLYHFPPLKGQYYPFMSNLSTLGGLLLLTKFF